MEAVPPEGTEGLSLHTKTGKPATLLIQLLVHMIIMKIDLAGRGLTASVISSRTSADLLRIYSPCVSVGISEWMCFVFLLSVNAMKLCKVFDYKMLIFSFQHSVIISLKILFEKHFLLVNLFPRVFQVLTLGSKAKQNEHYLTEGMF